MGRRPYAARVPMEVRREQLLDAALEVLLRDGHAALSVESVARAAGVTRPVVYGAFDGLGALLTALLDRQQARALAQLADALRPDSTLLDGVDRLAHAVADDPETWTPILAASSSMPALVADRIDADRAAVRRQIAQLLRASGLPEDADVDLAAHTVVAAMEHLGRLMLADPEQYPPQRAVAFAAGLLRTLALTV